MVSSGTVNGDASTLTSILNQYSSEISSLSSTWKGLSHDNLTSKAEEFAENFSSTISGQMSSFANACDLYAQYKTAKSNYEISVNNYNQAISNNDRGYINSFQSDMNKYQNEMDTLKGQIESALTAASSTKLEASSNNAALAGISGSTPSKTSYSSSSAANQAMVNTVLNEVGKTISNYPGLGFHDGLWCADFVSEMLIENGYDIPRCSVAGDGDESYDIFHALRNIGSTVHLDAGAGNMGYSGSSEYDPSYSPQPGDVVLFNWDGDSSTDHVGIVVQDNGDGTITTVEGNTSGDAGSSCVAVKTRDRNLVYGYATPVKTEQI